MPLAALAELGVPIVEDAAQAFGAEGVARTGVLSTFSFFPTKNLFGLGDGGLVAANDEELADRIALLRFHGSREKKEFEAVGYNSRLDELQAAVLRLFLGELDGWNQARRDAAARYEELGLGELCELPADEPGHVYHMYVVRSPERDRLAEALADGRDRARVLLRDAAPPPAGASLPRLQGGLASRRPSGRRARTSRCRCGPGFRSRRRSGSSR